MSADSHPNTNPTKPDKITDKQLRWVEEYPKHFNASRAARDAGYSAESAADMGYQNKQNPVLMALVDERHKALTMSADEATRHLSDMAATRLNDFMVVREVQAYQLEEHYVTVLAEKQKEEIEYIEEFAGKYDMQLATLEGLTAMGKRLQQAKEQLLEYELLIMRYGNDVTKLVPGKPITQEVADLDLPALARAKDTGRIKSFSHTKEGIKVETYAADAAARDILKLNGRYEKHNQQKKAEVTITIGGRTIASHPPVSDEA
jgi:hypothetical protein